LFTKNLKMMANIKMILFFIALMTGVNSVAVFSSLEPSQTIANMNGRPYYESVNNLEKVCAENPAKCRIAIQNFLQFVNNDWKAFLYQCGGSSYLTVNPVPTITCELATQKLIGTRLPSFNGRTFVTVTSHLLGLIESHVSSLAIPI
jgi:hypothetical protein